MIIDWLRKALPSRHAPAIADARALLLGLKFEEARRLLEPIVSTEPGNSEATALLAKALFFEDPDRARTLAPIEVSQPGVRIDPVRLARFRDVCGNPDDGLLVPPAYPECLFLGTMSVAVLSNAFPFSPFGLIHVRQRIALMRPIDPGATLDLSCRFTEIRETERGFEVDFAMRADAAKIEAWNGTATLLSRNERTRSDHA
jgi:hypothetical protein